MLGLLWHLLIEPQQVLLTDLTLYELEEVALLLWVHFSHWKHYNALWLDFLELILENLGMTSSLFLRVRVWGLRVKLY